MLASSLLISGCAGTKKVKVEYIEKNREPLPISIPVETEVEDISGIELFAITKENQEEDLKNAWSKMESKKDSDLAGFLLSDEDYEKQALFNQQVRNYIEKLINELKNAKKYYEEGDE